MERVFTDESGEMITEMR